ncbi:MAG: DPP IV N-terminal domain-containing protein [Gemmatales bacterium]
MSARFTLARSILSYGLGFGIVVSSLTIAAGVEPEKVNKANYPNAFKYSREFIQQFSYDTSVTPNWINKSDNFWYVYRTSKGTTYWKVTPANRSKEPLFDHAKLAAALSELSKKPVDANGLALSRVTLTDDNAKLKFAFDDYLYEYELAANKLTKGGRAPRGFQPPAGAMAGLTQEEQQRRQEQIERFRQQQDQQQQQQNQNQNQQQQQDQNQNQNQQQQTTTGQTQETPRTSPFDYKNTSPDKKFYVYCYKNNIYLAEPDKEKEAIQLSKDGEEDYSFGGGGFGAGGFGGGRGGNTTDTRPVDPERKTRVNATWSPDSKACYVTRRDSRGIQELFLVDSIATPRPKLEKYKYPMPGEEKTRKSELFYVDISNKKLVQIKPHWKDESYFNIHWGKAANELRFIRRDRLQRNFEFCAFDVKAGTCKCVLEEGIENGNIEFQNARYLEDTDEMIWWSERSGWGHFYLYDRSGKLKNAITSGAYRASAIVAVDPKNRTLYFHGNAREPGENVYYQHLYSVRFDGTGLTLLDPGNANHTSTMSSSYQVLVDNTSKVDAAPTSTLRDSAGNKIMDLEACDLSRLEEAGWKLPTTFSVKAADGVTDLYGNIWVPFDMDPKKQYPIIAHVYPGPQTEGVTHTFAAYSSTQQMAQLGFIVIQVGHRGGTPTRSKAYHRYGYNNLRDYALEDTKSAIEQLALRFPYIDISRVGIYGHSGGGFMSAAALLQKPYNEFFKAAVAMQATTTTTFTTTTGRKSTTA